ncbi:unnamed protein product [Fraxinus pennsylvanica]|uniref:SAM-dependent methyltransferase Erg6/SMT-type domain-containing protein n=1 Tax=Fraxinus pennsylvanica TaxID=56036 RepID=A0AAD1ZAN6_9LAMI|nr:unnamed protein product [Fraxinus pennsylvanica]
MIGDGFTGGSGGVVEVVLEEVMVQLRWLCSDLGWACRWILQGIEIGDALPGLRSYKDIAEIAKKLGFEVIKEKDLAKPPANPWWSRLKMERIAYWRNHILVTILAWVGIASKGVVDVHEMLFVIVDYLTGGAICQAPKLEEVYSEIYRVLKLESLYVSYEWVTTELYRGDDAEHVEMIQGIEIGDALPGLRSYKDIAEIAKKLGFEVIKEKDLAKPPANPWWSRLKTERIAYWRNHILVTILAWVGIAPKGVVDVHEMLFVTVDYLTGGGETGILIPMYMVLCKKPEIN